jgi:hypothetical protein
MNKTVLDRIIDAQREFRKTHHHDPKAIHLTLEDEANLGKMGAAGLGSVFEGVLRNGVRKALPGIFGMAVIYDSAQFGIE